MWPTWAIVAAGLSAQFAIIMFRSVRQYERFNLSLDYGIFEQAWHQIATGHLNPYLSSFQLPYWKSHFELIMWPLSVLYWLNRNDGLTLVVIQNLAVVVTEIIALVWISAVLRERRTAIGLRNLILITTMVLFVANPWIYRATVQDFHFQAIGVCFAMGAAWELWAGRFQRCAIWVVLALMSGDVIATYVAAIGLAFVVTKPDRRRPALVVLGAALAWLALVAVLGANRGSAVDGYAYIAGQSTLPRGVMGPISVAKGALTNPTRPLHMVNRKWSWIYQDLGPSGFVGMLSPWTAPVAAAVLLENALNANKFFITPVFQNLPVFLFATAGTGLVVALLSARSARRNIVALLLLVAVLVVGIGFDVLHRDHLDLFYVNTATAAELTKVRSRIPDSAQVITSTGVIGRLSGRAAVEQLPLDKSEIVPIAARQVIFVFAPTAGNQPIPLDRISAMRTYVMDTLHAAALYEGTNVWAYSWTPRPTQHSLQFPE